MFYPLPRGLFYRPNQGVAVTTTVREGDRKRDEDKAKKKQRDEGEDGSRVARSLAHSVARSEGTLSRQGAGEAHRRFRVRAHPPHRKDGESKDFARASEREHEASKVR